MIQRIANSEFLDTLQRYRTLLVAAVQLALVVLAYTASFSVRILDPDPFPLGLALKTLPIVVAVRMATLAVFRLYHGLWRYVSVIDLLQIIKASTVGSAVFVAVVMAIFGPGEFPPSVFLLDWMGNIIFLGGVRLVMRLTPGALRDVAEGIAACPAYAYRRCRGCGGRTVQAGVGHSEFPLQARGLRG